MTEIDRLKQYIAIRDEQIAALTTRLAIARTTIRRFSFRIVELEQALKSTANGGA